MLAGKICKMGTVNYLCSYVDTKRYKQTNKYNYYDSRYKQLMSAPRISDIIV